MKADGGHVEVKSYLSLEDALDYFMKHCAFHPRVSRISATSDGMRRFGVKKEPKRTKKSGANTQPLKRRKYIRPN